MPVFWQKSIAVQMALLVLGSTALVLAAIEVFSYVKTRQIILETGEEAASHLTRSMTRRIEQEFRAVKKHRKRPLQRAPTLHDRIHDRVVLGIHLFLAGNRC